MDKVPVKEYLFHSCSFPFTSPHFNNNVRTGEGGDEKPHQVESYGLVEYKTTLHVLHLLVHVRLVCHDLHAHVHNLKIKQLLLPHLLNKLLHLAGIKLDR